MPIILPMAIQSKRESGRKGRLPPCGEPAEAVESVRTRVQRPESNLQKCNRFEASAAKQVQVGLKPLDGGKLRSIRAAYCDILNLAPEGNVPRGTPMRL